MGSYGDGATRGTQGVRGWVGHRGRTVAVLAALLLLVGVPVAPIWVRTPVAAAAGVPVRVLIPDPDNLQYLSFWVAVGAGYFRDEGLAVRVVAAGAPAAASQEFLGGAADVAIVPPPQFGQLVAQVQPVVAFANLLQHEPANVVVRREIATVRGITPALPVEERVRRLRGLRIGVAPGPAARLRVLLAAAGMDAERDVELVSVPGEEQNAAFAGLRVDALFAHTPYLEEALLRQNAVLVAHLSGGELAALARLQLHALVATRAYAAAQPAALTGLARGVARAQRLVHADRPAAVGALLRAGVPGLERERAELLVSLYEPAVPGTPAVSAEGVRRAVQAWAGGAGGGGAGGPGAGGPGAGGAGAVLAAAGGSGGVGPGGGGQGGGSAGGVGAAGAAGVPGGGAGGGATADPPAVTAGGSAVRAAGDLTAAAYAEYVTTRFAEEAIAPPRMDVPGRLGGWASTPAAILAVGAALVTLVLATVGTRVR